MQKWEYCTIYPVWMDYEQGWLVPLYSKSKGYKGTFTISGATREELEKNPNALAKTIAKLGQEGWEMVGCGNVGHAHTLYFKRPKEE